jgi:hypothetical protein
MHKYGIQLSTTAIASGGGGSELNLKISLGGGGVVLAETNTPFSGRKMKGGWGVERKEKVKSGNMWKIR